MSVHSSNKLGELMQCHGNSRKTTLVMIIMATLHGAWPVVCLSVCWAHQYDLRPAEIAELIEMPLEGGSRLV